MPWFDSVETATETIGMLGDWKVLKNLGNVRLTGTVPFAIGRWTMQKPNDWHNSEAKMVELELELVPLDDDLTEGCFAVHNMVSKI
jgi:hypothetical protein